MHSDFTREDYEHAARAVGLHVGFDLEMGPMAVFLMGAPYPTGDKYWNPPRYCGDALSLAVKLGMYINIEGMEIGFRIGGVLCIERIVLRDAGLEAAVCEAIFRAAIEIGKSMKGTP